MGKKKEYNLSEIDTKQAEDNGNDKKESFTVQEYDAIVNDGVTDQPCKQSDDGDQNKEDNGSLSGADQTDGEEENEHIQKQTEHIQKQTDGAGDENINHQPINGSLDNHVDNTGTTGTQIPTSKTAEEYTSIDLEETKHAPDPSKGKPVMFWLRKNLCLIIGISFVIALIAIISIAATSKREPSNDNDELMARKGNTAGFIPAIDENPNNTDYNSEVESTTPQFHSTESDTGNPPWPTVHDSETTHDVSTTKSVLNVMEDIAEDDDYDYDYSGNVKNSTNPGSEGLI